MTNRWLILLAIAGGLLLLRCVPQDAGLAAPAHTTPAALRSGNSVVATVPTQAHLLTLDRSIAEAEISNPFAAKSWLVQPPPMAVVAPPPSAPPGPPPLPFTLAGSLEAEPGRVIYYLIQGNQSYAVAQGDTFAGQYRLEAVERDQLVINYLPLGVKQLLAITADF